MAEAVIAPNAAAKKVGMSEAGRQRCSREGRAKFDLGGITDPVQVVEKDFEPLGPLMHPINIG
jgi:hypothetical protein